MADVSVIMPAKNAGTTIVAALRSVLRQQHLREVLVIDDASTDGTAAAVAALGDPRIRVMPCRGAGFVDGMNTGFAAATGEFVAQCDADDLYPEGRLAWQVPWLRGNAEFLAVSGGFHTLTSEGRHVTDLACDRAAGEVTAELLSGRTVTHFCAWLTRRSALEAVDGMRRWFVTGCDIDLQFRLAEAGRVWHNPVVAYGYRLHDSSMVHTRPRAFNLFFEQQARAFQLQRQAGAEDDLARGAPPELPDAALETGRPDRAATQVAGHLTGRAWRAFDEGRLAEALGAQARALAHAPGDAALWRSMAAMLLRAPGRAVRAWR